MKSTEYERDTERWRKRDRAFLAAQAIVLTVAAIGVPLTATNARDIVTTTLLMVLAVWRAEKAAHK